MALLQRTGSAPGANAYSSAPHLPSPQPLARIHPCSQVIEAEEIDRINILQAALKAMEGAAAGLGQGGADFLLVDGNRLPKVREEKRKREVRMR